MRYDDSNLSEDLKLFKSIKDAEVIIGGLSKPSKMPWLGWSISAKQCKVGGKLAKIPGSVCHKCYALKGRYVFKATQNALNRRHENSLSPLFVPAFVYTLNTKASKIPQNKRFFRWFDSGDLQSLDMLCDINTIAKHTPTIQHWLPTKESTICRDFFREVGIPSINLTIRLSAAMMDETPPTWWPIGSAVFSETVPDGAKRCPAPEQGNSCESCRRCWDKNIHLVAYHAH